MLTHITVPLPESIRNQLDMLNRENFYLWMFVSQNDLWEEARDFIQCGKNRDEAEELPF